MSAEVPVLHPRTTLAPTPKCSACGHAQRNRPRDWHLLAGVLLGGILTSGSMLLTQAYLGGERAVELRSPAPPPAVVATITPALAPPVVMPLLDLRTMPPPADSSGYTSELVPLGGPRPVIDGDPTLPASAPDADLSERVRACTSTPCYLRELEGRRDLSPRLLRLRIASLQSAGRASDARRDMAEFVRRFPDDRASPAYRQVLVVQ